MIFNFDLWNVLSFADGTEAASEMGEATFYLSNFGVPPLISDGMTIKHPSLISDFAAETICTGVLQASTLGVALLSDYNASTHLLYISS